MTWPLTHAAFFSFCLLLLLWSLDLFQLITGLRSCHTHGRQGASFVTGQSLLWPLKVVFLLVLLILTYKNPLLAGKGGLGLCLLVILAAMAEIWARQGPLRRLQRLLDLIAPIDDFVEDNLVKLKYVKNRRLYILLLLIAFLCLGVACFWAGSVLVGMI